MKTVNISKNIRKLRRTEDITQKALGDLIGVSAGTISYYENNDSYPSLAITVRLAEVFNISLDELIC